MKKTKQKNNFPHAPRPTPHAVSGFTIVETLVAIAVLSLVIVAPLTLAQRSLNSSIYAKDQVTAFYLAQEAIEFARNVRDNNNLQGNSQLRGWLSGLDNKCINSRCGIDVTANGIDQQIFVCDQHPKDCQLTFSDPTTGGTGVYGVRRDSGNGNPTGGWQDTIFTRSLIITRVPINSDPNAAADLTATVTWTSGTVLRSITVSERIFDWFPAPAQ